MLVRSRTLGSRPGVGPTPNAAACCNLAGFNVARMGDKAKPPVALTPTALL
jgi:hypothetical protein